MKTIAMLALAVSVFTRACESPESGSKAKPEGFGTAQSSDLTLAPEQTNLLVEWGNTSEIPVNVTWKSDQKYAVQVAPAEGTPEWLHVTVSPVIIDPPGSVTVTVEPELGHAKLGKHKVKLQASAYGMKNPVEFDLEVEVVRQSGPFEQFVTLNKSLECRNICGKLSNNRIAFYDLLKEKGQTCEDKNILPDNQRIGVRQFNVSQKGYGYGRTCRLAGVWENTGSITLVNIGFFDAATPRGEPFITLSSVETLWLSPDNTLALVKNGSAWTPYDVIHGTQLGEQCRATGDVTGVSVDGDILTVFSTHNCEWQVK